MKRAFLTLICLTRDNERYVQEHALFHSLVGFDRLIYMLHVCKDGTEAKLKELQKKLGLDIIIHHCPNTDRKIQMGVYKAMLERYGKYTEWALPLDDDEYVYCTNPTVDYQDDLKHLLRGFRKNVAGVAFQSRVFGSSSQILSPTNRFTAYTQRLPLDEISCSAIKTFIRPNKLVKVISPHTQEVAGSVVRFDGEPFTIVDGWRSKESAKHYPVCFNHYYTGSLEDWLARYRRGSCNDLRPNHAYSMDEFLYHTVEMEYDNTILRYQPWYQSLVGKLK